MVSAVWPRTSGSDHEVIPMTEAPPLEVLVLRDVPEERRVSMERFADELVEGFGGHETCRVGATTVRVSGMASRMGRIGGYLARFVEYPLAARRVRADIYHIVDQGYADLATVLPKGRTVVTCHDLMLLKAQEGGAGFQGRPWSVWRFSWSTSYLKEVAHVVCVSQATKADLLRLRDVREDRISIIPNGISARFRRLGEDVLRGLRRGVGGAGRFALLHVSSGNPYKNNAGVLRVVAELRRAGLDVALTRVGRPLNPGEQALARELGVETKVMEGGFVSDERLVELYNACDVFLFPSYWEGFGWPALEAMACGLPLVTSDCPALAELVGDAGRMASPDDICGLAEHVGAILESQGLARELRRRGFERAAQYSWKRTVEAYARVYEAVALR